MRWIATSGRNFLSINSHNSSAVSEVGRAVPGEPGAGRGKREGESGKREGESGKREGESGKREGAAFS